ncbi:MAG TPA: hypothetical protein VF192_16170 [Longimicrobiales bacterium]
MSRSRDSMARLAVVGVAAVVLAGCSETSREATPVEPATTVEPATIAWDDMRPATLMVCPVAQEASVRAEIRPEGGTVSLGGHSVYFPPGAVPEPVEVKLTVPASEFVEVDIQVNGQEHYRLARPVLATLSYARCGSVALRSRRITVWHIDGQTRQPVERMASLDDRASGSVTFVTNHFSGYALAD